MKLVILGANGRTGKLVLQAAIEKGMDVTAVVRSADKAPENHHDKLTVRVGDPCEPSFLKTIFRGQDAVISALGGRSPTKAATSIYYRSVESMIEAARETGLKRVLVTSTALLFREQTVTGRILRLLVPNIVRNSTRMEDALKTSALNWTSARPGFLNDANEMQYRALKGRLPKDGTSVPRLALATFLIDALEDPETECSVYGVSKAGV